MALRDGPLPRRTAATDPKLVSDAPLFVAAKPIGGAEGKKLGAFTFTTTGALFGARDDGAKSALLFWAKPLEAPREMAIVDGYIEKIVPAPSGPRVLVQIVHPEHRYGNAIGGDDPRALAVVNTESGAVTMLLARGAVAMGFTTPLWSPDGKKVALSAEVKSSERTSLTFTIVIDAAKGTRLAETSRP